MTLVEIKMINDLYAQGLGYRKISAITGISANTVKTYCRRHKEELPLPREMNAFCRGCGKPIYRNPQYRPRLFCTDSCRMQYWNSHRDGIIAADEVEDFIRIQEDLERISITVETLQLWAEQKLASGDIDMEAYNLAKHPCK